MANRDTDTHRANQRRWCLNESTSPTGHPQACVRDHGHPGGHTPVDLDTIPGPVLANYQPNGGGRPRGKDGRFVSRSGTPSRTEARRLRAEANVIALRRPDLVTADGLDDPVAASVDHVGALYDQAAANITLEPGLVELAVQRFEHEVASFKAAAVRLQDEVLARSRFMVFAAAAHAQGHHPAAAYLFLADRIDPAGVAS